MASSVRECERLNHQKASVPEIVCTSLLQPFGLYRNAMGLLLSCSANIQTFEDVKPAAVRCLQTEAK